VIRTSSSERRCRLSACAVATSRDLPRHPIVAQRFWAERLAPYGRSRALVKGQARRRRSSSVLARKFQFCSGARQLAHRSRAICAHPRGSREPDSRPFVVVVCNCRTSGPLRATTGHTQARRFVRSINHLRSFNSFKFAPHNQELECSRVCVARCARSEEAPATRILP
jgi:hypothetical protein